MSAIFRAVLVFWIGAAGLVAQTAETTVADLDALFVKAAGDGEAMAKVVLAIGALRTPASREFLLRKLDTVADRVISDACLKALAEDPSAELPGIVEERAGAAPRGEDKLRYLRALAHFRKPDLQGLAVVARFATRHIAEPYAADILGLLGAFVPDLPSAQADEARRILLETARAGLAAALPRETRLAAMNLLAALPRTVAGPALAEIVAQGDRLLLAPALRALVESGSDDACETAARCVAKADRSLRRALLDSLAAALPRSASLWMAMLRSLHRAPIDAVRDVARTLATPRLDPMAPYVMSRLRFDGEAEEVSAALLVTADRRVAEAEPRVLELLRSADSHVRIAAAHALSVITRSFEPWEKLGAELLAGDSEDSVLDRLECLGDLEIGGPHVERWLSAEIAKKRTPWPVRAHLLRTAARLDVPGAADAAVPCLSEEPWQVKLAAIEALEKARRRAGLLPLAEALASEQSLIAGTALRALRSLTHWNLGADPAAWKTALGRLPSDWRCPPAEDTPPEDRNPADKRYAPRFYGVTIETNRVIFVLDRSGSMQEDEKLKTLKKELQQAIAALDSKARFNLVFFSNSVAAWSDNLRLADRENKAQAEDRVARLLAHGGTNLHGGVMKALEDAQADTIFIVTDGMPTVGDVVDPYSILAQVRKRNRVMRMRIHAIYVGSGDERGPGAFGLGPQIGGPAFLERLAKENGGTFRWQKAAAAEKPARGAR